MAVLALVGSAGDVDPVDATVGGLLDELVVDGRRLVAMSGDKYVHK